MIKRARDSRKCLTKPEYALLQELRQRQMGLKFRNQPPIGPYVVDFCCLGARLVVKRDRFITENGFRVLRVSAKRVLADLEGTVTAIVARAASPYHRPADGPPPRIGEDK